MKKQTTKAGKTNNKKEAAAMKKPAAKKAVKEVKPEVKASAETVKESAAVKTWTDKAGRMYDILHTYPDKQSADIKAREYINAKRLNIYVQLWRSGKASVLQMHEDDAAKLAKAKPEAVKRLTAAERNAIAVASDIAYASNIKAKFDTGAAAAEFIKAQASLIMPDMQLLDSTWKALYAMQGVKLGFNPFKLDEKLFGLESEVEKGSIIAGYAAKENHINAAAVEKVVKRLAKKPEAKKPEAKKPEAKKPEAKKPEAKPDASGHKVLTKKPEAKPTAEKASKKAVKPEVKPEAKPTAKKAVKASKNAK